MSTGFDISSCSFVTGAPVTLDSGWVVVTMDDVATQNIKHSVILRVEQGGFLSICFKMFRSKHVAVLPGLEEVVVVGDNGECTVVDRHGMDRDEYVTASPRSPYNTGDIRSAGRLGDDVIVVGMQYQAYRRCASGQWTDMTQGLPESNPQGVTGFECVLPLAEDEIYAAGWLGELWLYDGAAWRQLDSPTKRIITSLHLAPNGKVVGCGLGGLVLEGRWDQWQERLGPRVPEDLWSVASTAETTFAASLSRVYELCSDDVDLVDFTTLGAASFRLLVSGDGVLWSLGRKDLLTFDGVKWSRLA